MTVIAIVGTGVLGSRHLQALARLSVPLRVILIDPLVDAHNRALALLAEVGGLKHGGVACLTDVGQLRERPDIAIVSTNSRERASAVEAVCRLGCPRLILEKFLFPQPATYHHIAAVLSACGSSAWVNCGRRALPRFARLVELVGGRPVRYTVSGTSWGLASNVVHHLDEFAMLAGEPRVNVCADGVAEVVPSRRAGYFDVVGRLTGRAGRSVFTAVSAPGHNPSGDRRIVIEAGDARIELGQNLPSMLVNSGGVPVAEESYPPALQSEATAWHVATLLAGGEPPLPRYEQAASMHLAVMQAIAPHFESITGNAVECPIT